MKERLGGLLGWLWRWLGAALRWLWHVVLTFLAWLGRLSRLFANRQSLRAKERERRERLEAIGSMVYVLFKRSMVRNHDLLAECEKVRDIDVEMDQILDRADAIRSSRPAPTPVQPRVADQPAEVDAAADGVTTLDVPTGDATQRTVSVDAGI